jgi:hypothetical protein
MHERTALGAADVPDHELQAMVADALHDPGAELLSSRAEVFPYDLEALTTGGRYWVRGRARTGDGERPYAFFVKVVQSWSRSRWFAFVPEQMREIALASLPWEVEPAVYASELADLLPPGLSMPRAYAVRALDGLSAALWLEAVDHVEESWEVARFAEAARLIGRWPPALTWVGSPTSAGARTSRSSAATPRAGCATRCCRRCRTTGCGSTRW